VYIWETKLNNDGIKHISNYNKCSKETLDSLRKIFLQEIAQIETMLS
jgi:hypothetical protein